MRTGANGSFHLAPAISRRIALPIDASSKGTVTGVEDMAHEATTASRRMIS